MDFPRLGRVLASIDDCGASQFYREIDVTGAAIAYAVRDGVLVREPDRPDVVLPAESGRSITTPRVAGGTWPHCRPGRPSRARLRARDRSNVELTDNAARISRREFEPARSRSEDLVPGSTGTSFANRRRAVSTSCSRECRGRSRPRARYRLACSAKRCSAVRAIASACCFAFTGCVRSRRASARRPREAAGRRPGYWERYRPLRCGRPPSGPPIMWMRSCARSGSRSARTGRDSAAPAVARTSSLVG